MRKSRFTKAQIIGMLKQREAGWPRQKLPHQAGATLLRAWISGRILRIFLVVLGHVASNFGSLARLQAAMVIVNCAASLSVPRSIVWAIEPTVLAHPKGSSIFLRSFCDTA